MPLSADALTVVPVFKPEFPPPSHLGPEEAVVFRDVVGTADHGHFRPEDRELIALYATHVIQARRLMARKRRTVEQQRDLRAETALVMSLSTKLRLGPKSRAPDNRRAQSAGSRGASHRRGRRPRCRNGRRQRQGRSRPVGRPGRTIRRPDKKRPRCRCRGPRPRESNRAPDSTAPGSRAQSRKVLIYRLSNNYGALRCSCRSPTPNSTF
jgi:hypothetical protein